MPTGIAISSCKHYFAQTGSRIIQEVSEILETCEWNPQVIIVVGGCDDVSQETLGRPNFTLVKVPYQGFDFTAAYWLTQNSNKFPDTTHWFLSHDTVKFSFSFFHILGSFQPQAEATRLCNHYSMNMGIYSIKHLIRYTDTIKSLLIYDNSRAHEGKQRIIETEDCLFPKDAPILSQFRSIHPSPTKSTSGETLGLMKVYFHDLDFTKYQQNTAWAKKIHTEAYLPSDMV
jgi:hypothetical protein